MLTFSTRTRMSVQFLRETLASVLFVLVVISPQLCAAENVRLSSAVEYGRIRKTSYREDFGQYWEVGMNYVWSPTPGAIRYLVADDRHPGDVLITTVPELFANLVAGPDKHGHSPNVFDSARTALERSAEFASQHLSVKAVVPGVDTQFVPLTGTTPRGFSTRVLGDSLVVAVSGPSISIGITPPNALDIKNLARLYGVDHFNWQNRIVDFPLEWQFTTVAGNLVPRASIETPQLDPYPDGLLLFDNVVGPPIPIHKQPRFDHGEPTYYRNTPGVTDAFSDQPAIPVDYFDSPFDAITFETELVGQLQDGTIIPTGVVVEWRTNSATAEHTATAYLSTVDDGTLPAVVFGGVHDVRIIVPEPASLELGIVAGFAVAVMASRRRR